MAAANTLYDNFNQEELSALWQQVTTPLVYELMDVDGDGSLVVDRNGDFGSIIESIGTFDFETASYLVVRVKDFSSSGRWDVRAYIDGSNYVGIMADAGRIDWIWRLGGSEVRLYGGSSSDNTLTSPRKTYSYMDKEAKWLRVGLTPSGGNALVDCEYSRNGVDWFDPTQGDGAFGGGGPFTVALPDLSSAKIRVTRTASGATNPLIDAIWGTDGSFDWPYSGDQQLKAGDTFFEDFANLDDWIIEGGSDITVTSGSAVLGEGTVSEMTYREPFSFFTNGEDSTLVFHSSDYASETSTSWEYELHTGYVDDWVKIEGTPTTLALITSDRDGVDTQSGAWTPASGAEYLRLRFENVSNLLSNCYLESSPDNTTWTTLQTSTPEFHVSRMDLIIRHDGASGEDVMYINGIWGADDTGANPATSKPADADDTPIPPNDGGGDPDPDPGTAVPSIATLQSSGSLFPIASL